MDEFDDIFGAAPAKAPASAEPESNSSAQPNFNELDSMLNELDSTISTRGAAAVTDEFDDIFGEVSVPGKVTVGGSASGGGGSIAGARKGTEKTNQFRSAYEKDDFMGWLKDDSASGGSSGDAATPIKGRAGSVGAEVSREQSTPSRHN